MDFNLLPIELKKIIVTHLDLESLKNISQTSKELRDIAYEKLWLKPRFSWWNADTDFVDKISHFPICELHMEDFNCSLIKIVTTFPDLKMLYLDNIYGFEGNRKCDFSHLKYCLKIPLVIHTNALDWRTGETCEDFVSICKSLTVKEIHLDRQPVFNESHPLWTFEDVQLLTEIPLTIHTNIFDWENENFESFFEFFDTLSNVKGVHLDHKCSEYEPRWGLQEIKLLKEKCPVRGMSSGCCGDMDTNMKEYSELFGCNQM